MPQRTPALEDLRIDDASRDGGRKRLMAALAVLAVVAGVAAAAWWRFGVDRPVAVRTAVAVEKAAVRSVKAVAEVRRPLLQGPAPQPLSRLGVRPDGVAKRTCARDPDCRAGLQGNQD